MNYTMHGATIKIFDLPFKESFCPNYFHFVLWHCYAVGLQLLAQILSAADETPQLEYGHELQK